MKTPKDLMCEVLTSIIKNALEKINRGEVTLSRISSADLNVINGFLKRAQKAYKRNPPVSQDTKYSFNEIIDRIIIEYKTKRVADMIRALDDEPINDIINKMKK